MSLSLPSEQEFVAQQVLQKHQDTRGPAANRAHGSHVEDISAWDRKAQADPSIGTGSGGPIGEQNPTLI